MGKLPDGKDLTKTFHPSVIGLSVRIGIVISAVWLISIFSYALYVAEDIDSYFALMFALWGLLPLVITWGVWWILQAKKDSRNDLIDQINVLSEDQTKLKNMIFEIVSNAVIRRYRQIARQQGCAPTDKTSDSKIVDIYGQVAKAFYYAASERGATITNSQLNYIVLKFINLYENERDFLVSGEEIVDEWLRSEIKKYKKNGLSEEYKKELKLF